MDGKKSVSTEKMDSESACSPAKNESESKNEFPDIEISSSNPLSKRLKNSPDSFNNIEEMEVDVSRNSVVKSVSDIGMEWDSSDRRESAKRQKACPSSAGVGESAADLITDSIHPLYCRIFSAFDPSVLQPLDQIPDADKPFYYMNCASVFLTDFLTHLFATDFSLLTETVSCFPGQETADPCKRNVWDSILTRKDKVGMALFYLMQSYESIELETKEVKNGTNGFPAIDILIDARSQCINQSALLLTNLLSGSDPAGEQLSQSPLLTFVMHQWHRDFITELLTTCYKEHGIGGDFRLIFEPLLLSLWQEMCTSCSFSKRYDRPLQSLNELCDITIGAKRPICQLMVEMENWIVDTSTNAPGRELTTLSFLSPFLRLSVFAEDDAKIVDEFYGSVKLSPESTKIVNLRLQGLLSAVREEMHGIVHHIILNSSSRDQALSFLAEVMRKNEKRSQLQVDEKLVTSDGFMLNLAHVLQKLSLKIKAEKVDLDYPYNPDALIGMRKQETRLRMTSSDAETWAAGLSDWAAVKFQTQCFFLALECHHLSIIPCIRKYTRRIRAIRDYSRIADELSQSQSLWSHLAIAPRNFSMIKKWREQAQRLAKAKTCADAGLLDQQLLSSTLRFYCLHMSVLLRSLGAWNPDDLFSNTLPHAHSIPDAFAAYPEWFVEDVADFLLFTIQQVSQVIDCDTSSELIYFLVVLICTENCVSNPYLVAKLIEVIFLSCPSVHSHTEHFNQRLLSHPLAQAHLAKALMKFYTDVESTGASSEFYDKFTIRYHISIILKSMWVHPVHQAAIVSESRKGDQFVRFVNMLMNDTTFLLDESMESLKRIHEVQEAMDREEANSLTSEQQQTRQRQLANDERQCRSYLTLASETVDMFHYLTKAITEPFFRPVSFRL